MELSWMHFDVCQTCNDSKAIIFDPETNEMVCSSCGIVLRDNVEAANSESKKILSRRYREQEQNRNANFFGIS